MYLTYREIQRSHGDRCPQFLLNLRFFHFYIRIVCVTFNLKGILHPHPRSITNRHWLPMFETKSPVIVFFKLMIMVNRRYERNSRFTTCIRNISKTCSVIHCAHVPTNSAYCCFRRIKPWIFRLLLGFNQWNSSECIYLCYLWFENELKYNYLASSSLSLHLIWCYLNEKVV